MARGKEERCYRFMDFSMRELSSTINLMVLEHSRQATDFTMDSSRMDSKMERVTLDGTTGQLTREISEKIKDREKDFSSLNKEALRVNGKMTKSKERVIS